VLTDFAWRVDAERLLQTQQEGAFSDSQDAKLGDAATLAFIAEIKKRLRQQHEDPPNT
jgi:hypothetical protein